MRVFWYNGGLQILPETKWETELLCTLTDGMMLGEPPEMQHRIPSGDVQSGDGLFELLVGNEQTSPCSLTRKSHHKKQVICINKLS